MSSSLNKAIASILNETSKENANIRHSPAGKMLQIGSEASKRYYLDEMIPQAYSQAHSNGEIHIHDLDFYFKTATCIHVPLKKMLDGGFNTGNGYIRSPKRFASAMALAAIILQAEQNDQHGGVSYLTFDHDLEEYVLIEKENIERELYRDIYELTGHKVDVHGEYFKNRVQSKLYSNVYQAMEAFIHNLNTMHSRAGAQVPFTSVNLGDATSPEGRLVIETFLKAFGDGLGKHEIPIFPQIIFKLKSGVSRNPGDPNYDLRLLAEKIAANSINPTFFNLDATFNLPYGTEAGAMGCRTRVCSNINGPTGGTGRGNASFSSINLVRPAIKQMGIASREERIANYFQELNNLVDLGMQQLYERYVVQCRLRGKDLPFMMGQNVYLDAEKVGYEDSIEPALRHSTLSLGFIGLAETLTALIGEHHGQSKEAQDLGLQIIKFMRDKLDATTEQMKLNFTLLATPAEGLSSRFVGIDKQKYGVIPGVTDQDYYTNSFHLPVHFDTNAYDKVKAEAPYHELCNAGHISYVEFDASPKHNLEVIHKLVDFMCDQNMGYFGINHPADICEDCGVHGTFKGDECPICKSDNIIRIRKVTGYLGFLKDFGKGKKAEESNRKAHGA